MTDAKELMVGGAAIGLLAAGWGHVKGWASWILSLLIVHVDVQDMAEPALSRLLWREFKRSPFGHRRYGAVSCYVRPESRYLQVGHEQFTDGALVLWRGWRPLMASFHAGGRDSGMSHSTRVTFIRGMYNADALVTEALASYNKAAGPQENVTRFRIEKVRGMGSLLRMRPGGSDMFKGDPGQQMASSPKDSSLNPQLSAWRLLGWRLEELGEPPSPALMGDLSLGPAARDLVADARQWMKSKDWYEAKRIPWRRGYLLTGSGGTGKTSLCRALACDLDLPVRVFDLTSMSNNDLAVAWTGTLNQAPCMALFEDIDAVFNGRENVLGEEGGGLTFDCLLNCLSGVERAEGVLVVATTNRPEVLDPALGVAQDGSDISSRPGRLDRVVYMGPPDEAGLRHIAERILSDIPGQIEPVVQAGLQAGDTGARFQARCEQIALAAYWSKGDRR